MPDILTPLQRHTCMSRIRGKDTKPEILVRRGLHARGFRFRLHERKLPGKPDLTLPKYGVAVMVNGCFWHSHKGCKYATKPKSNGEFWEEKIKRNQHRDEVTTAHLEALGWTVITIWECELRGKEAAVPGKSGWLNPMPTAPAKAGAVGGLFKEKIYEKFKIMVAYTSLVC